MSFIQVHPHFTLPSLQTSSEEQTVHTCGLSAQVIMRQVYIQTLGKLEGSSSPLQTTSNPQCKNWMVNRYKNFTVSFFYMCTVNYDESRIMQQIARADAIISGCWGECAQESGERWGCLAWGREEDSMPFHRTCNQILWMLIWPHLYWQLSCCNLWNVPPQITLTYPSSPTYR